jgi:PPOX class probable F420-dependent enzyme
MTNSTPPVLSDEVKAYLSEGTRTGKLGFLASDGRPLVTPVGFVVAGDQLVFTTFETTAKARLMVRDPRVSLCVDDEHPPYSFVQVQGIAEITDDPADLLRVAMKIGARYMGSEEAGRRNAVPGELVVHVTPTKVLTGFNIA